MAEGATNNVAIGRSLGHKFSQSTTVYARLNLDPVRDSVEKATEVSLPTSNSITGGGITDEGMLPSPDS